MLAQFWAFRVEDLRAARKELESPGLQSSQMSMATNQRLGPIFVDPTATNTSLAYGSLFE
jgi:hypothetical protein